MIPQTKKQMVEKALEKGRIQVFVNSKVRDVVLPRHLMSLPQVILNLSHNFEFKLTIADDGIATILSFGGKNEPILLPWEAIWFLRSPATNEAMLFFEGAPLDDLPVEVLQPPEFTPETLTETLKPIQGSIDGEGQTTPPRTGHLRVVH